jgi:uncharacterized protein (DUF2249 family)
MSTATDVARAILAHHEELEASLSSRVEAVLTAARDGQPYEPAVAELNALLAADVLPHARAEEDVVYPVAANGRLQVLVAGMLFEHEALMALATELGSVRTSVDAAAVARALREVFVGHVRRENELLIPALAADPTVDLFGLLPELERRFLAYRAPDRQLQVAGPPPSPTGELDVRAVPRRSRHDLVFQRFAATAPGEAMILVNDHEPRHLHRQFLAERGGEFDWAYLEAGPDVWRVRISRIAG